MYISTRSLRPDFITTVIDFHFLPIISPAHQGFAALGDESDCPSVSSSLNRHSSQYSEKKIVYNAMFRMNHSQWHLWAQVCKIWGHPVLCRYWGCENTGEGGAWRQKENRLGRKSGAARKLRLRAKSKTPSPITARGMWKRCKLPQPPCDFGAFWIRKEAFGAIWIHHRGVSKKLRLEANLSFPHVHPLKSVYNAMNFSSGVWGGAPATASDFGAFLDIKRF